MWKMYKVLVVDDEVLVRKGIILETDWSQLGCKVVAEASNGEEAWCLTQIYQPDIVICDIRMPKLDGMSYLSKLREAQNEVSVIFLSAYSDFAYTQKAIRLGAADYLLKPFEDSELVETLQSIKNKIEKKRQSVSIVDESDVLTYEVGQNGKQSKYVLDALDYMNQHYGDSKLTVTHIATSLNLSEGHLSHLFKKETGYTINNYLTRYRIQSAMKLLQNYHYKVYEVGEMVGYKDMTYFSSLFKKIVGVTPSAYQQHYDDSHQTNLNSP